MNILAHEAMVAFILVILSDGVAAGLASRHCYRLRDRALLAWPLAVFMAGIALVDLSDIVNVSVNGTRNPNSISFWQALAGRVVRSAVTWYLALKLMNGYSSAHKEDDNEETSNPDPPDIGESGPIGP